MTRAQATRTTLLNQWERCSTCGGLEWREYHRNETISRWGGETIVFSRWVCADCDGLNRLGSIKVVADFDRERRCFPTHELLRARLAQAAS